MILDNSELTTCDWLKIADTANYIDRFDNCLFFSGFFGSIANGHIENGPVPQSQGVTMASIVSQQSGLTAAAIVASNLPQSSQTPQRVS